MTNGESLIDEIASDSPESFSRQLLGMVETILSRNRLTLRSLKAISAATGPGSFTGIRIGLATIEGIALSAGTAVMGVSTLEAMAMASGKSGLLVPVVDAGGGNAYWARFERDGDALRRLSDDHMGTSGELARAGDADVPRLDHTGLKYSVAGGAALCAAARMKAGELPAGPLTPNYIQKSAAERMQTN